MARDMDRDDDAPRPGSPLEVLVKEKLDDYSVYELEARVQTLQAEISRAEQAIVKKKASQSAADSVFKK